MPQAMTPDEIAYQNELKRTGLPIPLDTASESMRALLDRLAQDRWFPAAAKIVRLGRFVNDDGIEMLVIPNSREAAAILSFAATSASYDQSVAPLLRDRASDLVRSISKAIEDSAPVSRPVSSAEVGRRSLPLATPSDPKTTEEAVQAADVGSPKQRRRLTLVRRRTGEFYPEGHKRAGQEVIEVLPRFTPTNGVHLPGDDDWPLTVALGLGVDSVAILVGLVQLWRETGDRRWIPDAITFADVGSEKDATYEYLGLLDDWLSRSGFPRVTVVATAQGFVRPKWGSYRTLEQKCLINHTLPKIAFGFRRAECSITWKHVPQHEFFKERYDLDTFGGRGPRIIRAVGYDVDETERACGKGGRSTYRTHEEAEKSGDAYEFWYPLMEWGWTRARCIAEIRAEIGREPEKSSCTMCPAMKAWEVLKLDKDDLERAIFMEQVAKLGRRPLTQKGLNPAWSWTALALADESELPSRGDVLELSRSVGPVISRERVDDLIRLAKRWVARSPKEPYSRDMSDHPITSEIAAFTKIKGFRDTGRMDMDKADTEAEEADGP